ncbi:hypothetical protein H6P81_010810 [Aristolochia fimbriata]|uniref:Sm domain-containing protein n=1 Tax=Aristolochia fimbriata TaxID=158543 RepID=A0AAV7EPT8_ARIFI|nr:hypothetical protein H6P81_010810 [Aristolochia fimbriata]
MWNIVAYTSSFGKNLGELYGTPSFQNLSYYDACQEPLTSFFNDVIMHLTTFDQYDGIMPLTTFDQQGPMGSSNRWKGGLGWWSMESKVVMVRERGLLLFNSEKGNMSGGEKAGSTKTPADFLKSIRGRPVVVKLNSGVDYRGILACLDGYMNIAMEQTEEYVNGQLKNKYGDAFIRGNNVLYISTSKRTLAEGA